MYVAESAAADSEFEINSRLPQAPGTIVTRDGGV